MIEILFEWDSFKVTGGEGVGVGWGGGGVSVSIRMQCYQCTDALYKDKTIVRLSQFNNGNL